MLKLWYDSAVDSLISFKDVTFRRVISTLESNISDLTLESKPSPKVVNPDIDELYQISRADYKEYAELENNISNSSAWYQSPYFYYTVIFVAVSGLIVMGYSMDWYDIGNIHLSYIPKPDSPKSPNSDLPLDDYSNYFKSPNSIESPKSLIDISPDLTPRVNQLSLSPKYINPFE